MKRILIISFTLVSLQSWAQKVLPDFSVTTRGNGKAIISWNNAYPVVTQISIQRSYDSLRNYKTLLTVPDPHIPQNGFVDSKAPTDYQFYRLFIVLDSGKYFKFDQAWISIAFSLVLVLALVYWFLLIPAQKRLIDAVQTDTTDDHEAAQKVRSAKVSTAMATGLIHLGLVAMVLIMIWKPGY